MTPASSHTSRVVKWSVSLTPKRTLKIWYWSPTRNKAILATWMGLSFISLFIIEGWFRLGDAGSFINFAAGCVIGLAATTIAVALYVLLLVITYSHRISRLTQGTNRETYSIRPTTVEIQVGRDRMIMPIEDIIIERVTLDCIYFKRISIKTPTYFMAFDNENDRQRALKRLGIVEL